MTDHDYVSADHEAYMFGEGADKVHQGWSLVWWPGQDETLRSERRRQRTQMEVSSHCRNQCLHH